MIFQCSGVKLDTECFSIFRNGEPVPVTPKAFDLLVFLIRNRDRVVSRDQLLDEIWQGRPISDGALSNEIKLARAVVGDDGKQQTFIRTVRGRGYQFIGLVSEIGSAPDLSSDTANGTMTQQSANSYAQSSRVAGARHGLGPHSIAVLPFENRSQQDHDAYFSDGFHDELITHISRIKNLTTISRTSVMAYRDNKKSIRTIGAELQSMYIIEGGVLRIGDQVRINVRLIDAGHDIPVWGEAYTRKLSAENVFAIQSEIALQVATKLRTVLSPQEQQDLARIPTQSIAALESYFRGRVSYGLASSAGFSAAIEHFQQAILHDPQFAEAHAQLAMALLEKVHFGGMDVADQNALAEPVIQRALTLKPELSEAHEALGFLERHRGNFEASQAAYEEALSLNPNNTSALRMFGYFTSWDCEQPEQALTFFNRARLLDPQNHHTLSLFSQALMDLERFDESRAVIDGAIESAPNSIPPLQMLGQLCSWKLYRHDEATQAYQRAFLLDPGIPWTTFFLATACDDLRELDRAECFFEQYLKLHPDKAFAPHARLKLHRMRGEVEDERFLLAAIKDGKLAFDPWHDSLCLDGFDTRYAHPDLSAEFFETIYPALTQADPDIEVDNDLFKLALIYATLLHLNGDDHKAAPLTERLLQILPSKPRFRRRGIDLMDAWLHMAMGDDVAALNALREWRELGGCRDLMTTRIVSDSLSSNPDFQALNIEILEELSAQRSNLARLEATGELAPIPALT